MGITNLTARYIYRNEEKTCLNFPFIDLHLRELFGGVYNGFRLS